MGMAPHVLLQARYDYSCIEPAAVKIGNAIFEVGTVGSYTLNGISNAELPHKMADKHTLAMIPKRDMHFPKGTCHYFRNQDHCK